MTDPIIMVGVPPILLAVIGGGVAIALSICAGINNFVDRREARAEAEEAEASDAASEEVAAEA
ncbi:hypothetical protein E4J93_00420 [Collinsella sp. BA40]|uniref:hypothetical protein n=1 Tax=Collinsella sp. BA40 TaxID=2560852 RepID=UPI0011C9A037|nr:hypothetical protein [Collinsella sp. BA40]TXF38956.1 hypothetical protein E4J93_00420 [Collinsella sp. BA40]